MERTQEQIIQEQVAEKAKYATSVAAASGKVAKNAFMSTLSGAKSPGEKAVVFGALAGLIAFPLPWITLFGLGAASGFSAATEGSSLFWLHPISMAACFLLSSFNNNSESKKRILAARWYIVIGAFFFAPGFAAVCNVFSGAVGFGGYLATASAGAILLGGLLQISEQLSDLTTTASKISETNHA